MNDDSQNKIDRDDEALEAQLASLQPARLAEGFVNNLSAHLATEELATTSRRPGHTVVVLVALAAALLLAAWISWSKPTELPANKIPNPPRVALEPLPGPIELDPAKIVIDERVPSVWTYRIALLRSEEEFEAVLGNHAEMLLPSTGPAMQAHSPL